ncbi:hypothetical protein S7711_04163 [Stachybotrys chartarum IBT 7711]|uniref:Uncharacterized protein n=1 Tax=Stachybotrys chartarum (strain CBS 109288 / IBT 7711) TaxID=1280523 RepID=A0A084B6L8_STACB|nr:hypothetical protein S7711_04163 [Stachybotrys chartarum IBT 7711]
MAAVAEGKGCSQVYLEDGVPPASPPTITQAPIGPTGPKMGTLSTKRAFSLNYALSLAKVLTGYLFASFMPTVKATFSIAKCCTIAAREEFSNNITPDEVGFYPWEVCSYNMDIEFDSSYVFPSVNRTMAWAMEHCRGIQLSSLQQWLVPLSTYISPYIGVLLLCPVGGIPEQKHEERKRKDILNTIMYVLLRPVPEYIRILGDPASAIFGAWHEVWSDTMTLARLTPEQPATLRDSALWTTALAGDIRYSEHIAWKPKVLQALHAQTGGGGVPSQEDQIISSVKGKGPISKSEPLLSNASELENINRAIDIVITARKGFVSGILIPVLLLLAVTAATFYDAYTMRGDKDTALALAYCTWYSWILILAMAGNCYASALSPTVAKNAFNRVLDFGKDPLSTPLSHRYVNGYMWQKWADSPHGSLDYQIAREELKLNKGFWLRFCIGQFFGFCGVAFSTSCAIAIAWTTPTTGLGCRSFNFLLYAVFSFITAYLHVLCAWLELGFPTKTRQTSSHWSAFNGTLIQRIPQYLYWLFTFATSMIMVVGTLLHMIGVFRTCWCEHINWTNSTVIELNNMTSQAVDNARRYWLSTAYVAFGTVWLACLTAMAFRRYIIQKMEARLEVRNAVEETEMEE